MLHEAQGSEKSKSASELHIIPIGLILSYFFLHDFTLMWLSDFTG